MPTTSDGIRRSASSQSMVDQWCTVVSYRTVVYGGGALLFLWLKVTGAMGAWNSRRSAPWRPWTRKGRLAGFLHVSGWAGMTASNEQDRGSAPNVTHHQTIASDPTTSVTEWNPVTVDVAQ